MKPNPTKKFLKLGKVQGYKIEEIPSSSKNKEDRGFYFWLGQSTELGFSIALPISAGALFGLWVDEKMSTRPIATLIGIFAGILVAFGKLVTVVKDFTVKD